MNEQTKQKIFFARDAKKKKKAKITVKWINFAGEEKIICNGCYGLLLSKV